MSWVTRVIMVLSYVWFTERGPERPSNEKLYRLYNINKSISRKKWYTERNIAPVSLDRSCFQAYLILPEYFRLIVLRIHIEIANLWMPVVRLFWRKIVFSIDLNPLISKYFRFLLEDTKLTSWLEKFLNRIVGNFEKLPGLFVVWHQLNKKIL